MEMQSIHNNQSPDQKSQAKSRAAKVAQEFESLLTSIMMKSMRSTIFEGGMMPKSMGEKIYTDMLDLEYASLVSKNAQLGLADEIVRQIEALGNQTCLRALQGLRNSYWAHDSRLVPGTIKAPAKSTLQRVSQFDAYIDEASAKYTIDRDLIRAVIVQESAGNPHAISKAGAKGLMQLIDSTAKSVGVKQVFDPRENIMGGTKYLKSLLKEFRGNETLALASYNAGPTAVKRYQGIPPYKETQEYVKRVLHMRDTLKQSPITIANKRD